MNPRLGRAVKMGPAPKSVGIGTKREGVALTVIMPNDVPHEVVIEWARWNEVVSKIEADRRRYAEEGGPS